MTLDFWLKRTRLFYVSLVLSAFLSLTMIAYSHAAEDSRVTVENDSGQGEQVQDGEGNSFNPLVFTRRLIEPLKQELLGIELPDIERRYHIGITMNPWFGDILQKNYIRTPIKFKYGLAKNIELSAMPITYIHHPRRKTLGLGIADLDMGIKYRFLHILREKVSMAFAFNTIYPVGSNPDLMDGYVHYKPKLIVSKTLDDYHDLQVVTSIGWDIIDGSSEPLLVEDEGQHNIIELSLGFRLPRGVYSWSLEYIYTTEKLDGGQYEGFTMAPGWHWNIPREQTEWFPGDLGLSLGLAFGLMDDPTITYITKISASIPISMNVNLQRREFEFESEELREYFKRRRENNGEISPAVEDGQ